MRNVFLFVASGFTLLFAVLAATTIASENKSKSGAWRGQPVTEFDAAEDRKFGWEIVNDGVMGGLSKGKVDFTDAGTMKFSGNLSLENNGGFSTVRSEDITLDLGDDLGLLMLVKGDGRTYQARLATDARYRGMEVSFMGEFETTKGKWQEVKIPFSSFKGSFRGIDLDDQVLDSSKIRRVGILLGDKKQGPFALEVDWIRTYGKGQGGKDLTKAKKGPANLVETVLADGRFKTLATALTKAELVDVLQGDDPLTVFAPTDEAFAKISEKVLKDLLRPENKEKLVAVLTYHVVPGRVSAGDALNAGKAESVQGAALEFGITDGLLKVNDSTIRTIDLDGGNGVIHVIDSVLLPPAKEKAQASNKGGEGKASAARAILTAIDKGVPLYNGGDAEACAEVYRDCLDQLAENEQIDGHARRMLAKVVEGGQRHHSSDGRAWLYRRALDGMMAYLSRSMN